MNTDRANTLSEVRSEVLNENSRSLILINGGGAVALATWLQAVWDKPWAKAMLEPQLLEITLLLAGAALGAVSPLVRYISFFHSNTATPRRNPWWWANIALRTLSAIAFIVGMGFAVKGAWCALPATAT